MDKYITTIVANEHNDHDDEEKEQNENQDKEPVEEEQDDFIPEPGAEKIVKEFFDKFLINAEGSATNDNVDVVLLMRAMPTKVLNLTLSQV